MTMAPTLPDVITILPSDNEAECCVIGSMLADLDCIPYVRAGLTGPDFFDGRARAMFGAICRLLDEGKPVDLVSLRPLLTREKDFDLCGGLDYVEQGPGQTPSAANHAYYTQRVKQMALLRGVIGLADTARREAMAPDAQADGVLAAIEGGLSDLRGSTPGVISKPMTAAALLAEFPQQREAVIEGWLRRGEVGSLISAPKLWKSWMMLFICLSVATGRRVFDFATRPGRVLLLDFELSGGTLAKRLQTVAMAMGLDVNDLGDSLTIHPLRGRRLDVNGLGAYLRTLPPGRFDFVAIDPLYRLFGEDMDENSNVDFARLFGRLQGFAEAMDAAFLCVHHLSKGDQSFKSITDLGSGGGSQARAADAHLALRPHAEDGAAVLGGVVRSFPPFPPFVLRFEYPLWQQAPDLDPADLYRPPRRTATGKAKAEVQPAPPSWDTARFAAEVLTDKPTVKAVVVAQAVQAGMKNEHQALKLLQQAEATGKAHRWTMGKDRRIFYANTPQAKLDPTP